MSIEEQVREIVRAEVGVLRAELLAAPLTLEDVAAHFQVSMPQVRRWMRRQDDRRRLRAFNVGEGEERADWRVERAELDRWKREAGR